MHQGKRSSIAVNALEPAMKRANLTVVTQAMVLKITMVGTRATGIEYRIGDGPVQSVLAHKEVLLCACAQQHFFVCQNRLNRAVANSIFNPSGASSYHGDF